jgi:hypothetical protein
MTNQIKDIENPGQEFNQLTERFRLLENRLLAVAMDYKYHIEGDITNHEIYNLRDSIMYRIYSARFHVQLLLEHHHRVEKRLENCFKQKGSAEFFSGGFDVTMIKEQSVREIYSIFDSITYHLCSIYDYLFRLINFAHGKTILDKPKWNRFQDTKHKKEFIYCSEEMTNKLEKIDQEFVYPLIGHRSHLIHTEHDTGDFTLDFNLNGENFVARFFATELFKKNFPEMQSEFEEWNFTIKYSAFWLIDKTLKTTTEVLFALKEDMEKNKKIPFGFFAMIGDNGQIQSPSVGYWGDENEN